MDLKTLIPNFRAAMLNAHIGGHPYSPLTVDDYSRRMELFLSGYQDLTLETAKAALRAIPLEQHGKHGKLYKAITCFAKYLHQEGHTVDFRLVVTNKKVPPELAELRRKATRAPKQLTVSDKGLQQLKIHCENPFELLVVTLLSATGLRASEACALTLDDCDFNEGKALVRKGKGNKTRTIPLSPWVIKAINKHLTYRDKGFKPSDPILSHDWPDHIKRTDLNDALNAIGERAGVSVTPHALRRAFVTISHGKGIPLDYLRIICGHSDIKTTMGYCKTAEADALDALRNLDI